MLSPCSLSDDMTPVVLLKPAVIHLKFDLAGNKFFSSSQQGPLKKDRLAKEELA